MHLSIVTTLYKSSRFVDRFYARATEVASRITDDFEIIFVNDGSPDDSAEKAVALHHADPRVVVVDLSRNFGHHRAMMIGLNYARGEYVFLIDSDLDEDPALLNEFYEALTRQRCDVVYGVQNSRRGNLFEVLFGELFYWVINNLGGERIPRNLATVRLMTKRYVRALVRHREREMIISRLWVATGFEQIPMEIAKAKSERPSTYSLGRRLRMVVDHLTTFTNVPLYFLFYIGLGTAFLSGLYLTYVVLRYAFVGDAMPGWTSLIASVWMFGGLSLFAISMIGIYVAHIFSETKSRPYAIVRQLYQAGKDLAPARAPALTSGNDSHEP